MQWVCLLASVCPHPTDGRITQKSKCSSALSQRWGLYSETCVGSLQHAGEEDEDTSNLGYGVEELGSKGTKARGKLREAHKRISKRGCLGKGNEDWEGNTLVQPNSCVQYRQNCFGKERSN